MAASRPARGPRRRRPRPSAAFAAAIAGAVAFSLLPAPTGAQAAADYGPQPFGPDVEAPHAWILFRDAAGVAVDGWDLVSYREPSGPRPGQARWVASHEGVSYWFATEANRDAFAAEPDRYLPVCGGWDALMCGVDPEQAGFAPTRWAPTPSAFRVVDDRLLLLSERPQWNTAQAFDAAPDPAALLSRADAFWAERVARARRIGVPPPGMNPRGRLELADWTPLLGRWRCEGAVRGRDGDWRTIGTADWTFGFGYDGMVVEDRWTPHDNPGSSGPAIRTYDPLAETWSMAFIPSSGPRSQWWQMDGRWVEGELRIDFESQGGTVRGHVRFTDIGPDRFLWISSRSFDSGETWIDDYQRADCVRVAPAGGVARR